MTGETVETVEMVETAVTVETSVTCETDETVETGAIVNKTEVTRRFTNSRLLLLIVLSLTALNIFSEEN